jgi:hypothetical protein
MKMEQAACILQRAWRHMWRFHTTQKLVKTLLKTHKLNENHIRRIPFDELITLLKTPAVVSQMRRVLVRLMGQEEIRATYVLSLYILKLHPREMLEEMDSILDNQMRECGYDMFARVESIFRDIMERKPFDHTEFREKLIAFQALFEKWRAVWNPKLQAKITETLDNLFLEITRVDSADHAKLEQIDNLIERLRTKLLNSSGILVLNAYDTSQEAKHMGRLLEMTTKEIYFQLCHEVLLKPFFSLRVSECGDWIPQKYDFGELVAEVERADYRRFFGVLKAIRENKPLAVLPLAIEEELSQNALGRAEDLMLTWLAVIVAPSGGRVVRDEGEATAFKVVQTLQLCWEQVLQQRVDAEIVDIQSKLRRNDTGILMEKNIFEQAVQEDTVSLDVTSHWLLSALSDSHTNQTLEAFAHATAYLLDKGFERVPEVFALDERRLRQLSLRFDSLVKIHILLLYGPSDVWQNVTKQWEGPMSLEAVVLANYVEPTDAVVGKVRRLLFRATRLHIILPSLRVRAAPRNVRVPWQIKAVVDEFMDNVADMTMLHFKVYSSFYDIIMPEALRCSRLAE